MEITTEPPMPTDLSLEVRADLATAAKHTPGPWAVHHTYGRSDIEAHQEIPDSITVFTDDGRGNGIPIGTSDANARLIAAAPELLAALEALLADALKRDGGPGLPDALHSVDRARAALARAKGE